MTLCVSREADPDVKISVGGYEITVGALRAVDHAVLAASIDLTLEQFEDAVREWCGGIGLSYGVLID